MNLYHVLRERKKNKRINENVEFIRSYYLNRTLTDQNSSVTQLHEQEMHLMTIVSMIHHLHI